MKQTLEEAAYDYATQKTNFRKDVLKEVDADDYVCRHSDCMEDFQRGAEWKQKQDTWISVEKEPPPVGVDVIHTNIDTGRIYYGQVNKVGTLMLGYTPYGEVTATHYMIIPELSFDDILEANKDVLERIKEKGD